MAQSKRVEFAIEADGAIVGIYSDDLAVALSGVGDVQVRRASHVEPAAGGGWSADLSPVGGPVLGPYALRQGALDAEIEWLRAHVIRGRI